MRREFLLAHILSFATLLGLIPLRAWADFILEFTDGNHVVVRQYVEDRETISIYTQRGTIGFRKEDIRRIVEVDAVHPGTLLLDTLTEHRPSGSKNGTQSSSHSSPATAKFREDSNPHRNIPTRARTGKQAELGQLEKQYTSVAEEIDTVWEKHMNDVAGGASQETLAENRRQLNALSKKRYTLLKSVRETAPHGLPDWVR
jgi:hypothetical protein